jgi:hypothetical protein
LGTRQFVEIAGCTVNFTAAVRSFTRYPYIPFLGPTTADVRVQKSRAADTTGTVDITLYVPKSTLNIHGDATFVLIGPNQGSAFSVSTCTT